VKKFNLNSENCVNSTRMIRELSGPLIVLLLAGTVLTATIFIIFAKRQITRFTLRSRYNKVKKIIDFLKNFNYCVYP